MYTTFHLLEKIEQLREEMQTMASKRGLTSPELLALSKKLDHLLNVYSGCCSINDRYLENFPSSEW